MNPAGVFAPDVNFVSAGSLYPTSRGGSNSAAAAAMSATSNTVTVDPTTGAAAPTTASVTNIATSGKTVYWWVGFLALLALMVFAARRAGGEEDFRNIRPTAYNFLTITLTSIVGIVAFKVLAARFRVPGASDIILAA